MRKSILKQDIRTSRHQDRKTVFGHEVMKSCSLAVMISLLIFQILTNQSSALLSEINIIPLRVESGSRPLAMGGAFVGLSNDVYASFFNPGGLPWAKGICLNFKDIKNLSASQAYPTGYGVTIGFGIAQTSLSELSISNNRTADFSSSVLLVSIGSKLSNLAPLSQNKIAQNVGLGLNFKTLLSQTLRQTGELDHTATGWELDAGMLYKLNRFSSIGLNAINVLPYEFMGSGGKISWDNNLAEAAPLILKTGLSAKVVGDIWSPIYLEDQELTLDFDIETTRSQSPSFLLASEWAYAGTYYLRAGYYNRPERTSISFGGGIRAAELGFDLASYTDPLKGNNSIYFSVLYFPEEWVFVRRPVKIYPAIRIPDPITNLYPEDNLITYEDRIFISGAAKPGVEIYVNEQPAHIDLNQKFSVTLPLYPGKNLVVIDGFLEGGKISMERKIFRKAKVIVAEERIIEKEIKVAKTPEQKKQLEEEKKKIAEKKERLETLVTMGVVEVSPEAEFSLEAPVTRGELASWLVKAANYPLPRIMTDPFRDVPKEHPLAPYIKVAVDRGLIKSFPDNTFRPNASISMAEGQEIFKKFGVIQ